MNTPNRLPTFVGDNGSESWIDVTVVSLELLETVSHWKVVKGVGLGSDHALITWELMNRATQDLFAGYSIENRSIGLLSDKDFMWKSTRSTLVQ